MSRMLITGLALLMLSGWVFQAVLTAARPGRLLLGDTLYKTWPLQPGECILIGLGLASFGGALVGLSPPGRRLIVLWRGRVDQQQAVTPPRQPQPAPAAESGIRKSGGGSAPPAANTLAETSGDHHGI